MSNFLRKSIAFLPLLCFGFDIKYIGKVDELEFAKVQIGSSEFVKEVFYNEDKKEMIVKLNSTFYMYCDVNHSAIKQWQREDINASLVYLKHFKDNKKLYCKKGDK